jgi:hypothetical protein
MSVMNFTSNNGKCQGQILFDPLTKVYTVTGNCKVTSADGRLKYIASAPADMRMSLSGSGLPFPSEDVAFSGSLNKGEVQMNGSNFAFQVKNPNSYYKNNGATLVYPHVQFVIGSEIFMVSLGVKDTGNRSLSSLPGRPNRSTGR